MPCRRTSRRYAPGSDYGETLESMMRGILLIPAALILEDHAYRLPDEFVVTAGRKPATTPTPPEWVG